MEPWIVVGVSRLERQSQLHWAVHESLRWETGLLIVHCYEERLETEMPDPSDEQVSAATSVLEQAAQLARSLGSRPETKLYDGFAGEALVEASDGARLLVIGSTHRSRLSQAMHSSVSSYCVRHAHCPVAVVPLGDR
ncbi:MAG: universal stress protein [Acidimicrobiales bacterium]|jgi:nucleotide-binding universal stress UspA family protein